MGATTKDWRNKLLLLALMPMQHSQNGSNVSVHNLPKLPLHIFRPDYYYYYYYYWSSSHLL
jgi:hypothetical protein